MEHLGNGRKRLHHDPLLRQMGLDLAQGDPFPLRCHLPECIGVGLQHGTVVATDFGRRCTGPVSHPGCSPLTKNESC